MPKKATTKSKRPFSVIEGTWSPEMAEHWAFRAYLAGTLGGMLSAIFDAGQAAGITSGVAYIPVPLRKKLSDFPGDMVDDGSGLLVYGGKGRAGWNRIEQPFSARSGLGQDLWVFWVGQSGTALLVARHISPSRQSPSAVFPLDTWELRLTWHPNAVRDGAHAFEQLWQPHLELRGVWPAMEQALERYRPQHHEVPNAVLRSALALADHMDPWSRQQIVETTWVNLINRVQDRVAWELSIEKLMPAIGDVMRKTLDYDLFEILVFTKVGKLHEEFLAWRNNRTGFGGKGMNLLLAREKVEELIAARKPRLIGTTADDGVLNPHLASLAQLQEGLIVPLVHEGRAEGLMSLYYRHPTGLQQQELERIAQLGNTLARSIANTNAHEQVQKMATTDSLTGLRNRRSFNEQMAREMRRAQRYKQHFGLIMIDIDHFKLYNDTNGHLMGDQLLQQFAEVLTESVRNQDIAARYGGEEFAVILPHTNVEEGLVVAEKVRRRVEEANFPGEESQPGSNLTVSVGVADSLGDVKTVEDLTIQADLALYHAKETGRNRSCRFTEDLVSNKKK